METTVTPSWRDCFMCNAQDYWDEIQERVSVYYDPYAYVEGGSFFEPEDDEDDEE